MSLPSCSEPAAVALRDEPVCRAGAGGEKKTTVEKKKKNKRQVVSKEPDPLPAYTHLQPLQPAQALLGLWHDMKA